MLNRITRSSARYVSRKILNSDTQKIVKLAVQGQHCFASSVTSLTVEEQWKKESSLLSKLNEINIRSPYYSIKPSVDGTNEDHAAQLFINITENQDIMPSEFDLWTELQTKTFNLNPPDMPEVLNSDTLPPYVKKLTKLNTRTDRRMANYVSEVFDDIVDTNIRIYLDTYNLIIGHYASRFEYDKVATVLKLLNKQGIRPTIETYNRILYPLINSLGKPTFRYLAAGLKQIESYRLVPDLTTWFIVFSILKNRKNLIYQRLVDLKVDLKPIMKEVVSYQLISQNMAQSEIIEYLDRSGIEIDSNILAAIVDVSLKRNDPLSAWKLIKEWDEDLKINKKNDRVPSQICTKFVDYFTFKNEFYNAIGIINLFTDTLEFQWVFKNYSILLQRMCKVEDFENWSILTRRFYLDTVKQNRKSVVSDVIKRMVISTAKNYGYQEYKLQELTTLEHELTESIFAKLRWNDLDNPNFELESNEESFKEAAKFLISEER